MFIVFLKYVQPLRVIGDFLEEHVDFLEKYDKGGDFIFSGRRDPKIGVAHLHIFEKGTLYLCT
ncbi:hypothetical protein DJ93_5737 [Bacillus clarus]|uniref:Uncharacterized protein n=1 Tax=Bacillus clarus TaxID=2338372 RepID=A0A090YAL7_9BACI|nr:hypothetical protein DJ93_5737 [Bacillus clarus]